MYGYVNYGSLFLNTFYFCISDADTKAPGWVRPLVDKPGAMRKTPPAMPCYVETEKSKESQGKTVSPGRS